MAGSNPPLGSGTLTLRKFLGQKRPLLSTAQNLRAGSFTLTLTKANPRAGTGATGTEITETGTRTRVPGEQSRRAKTDFPKETSRTSEVGTTGPRDPRTTPRRSTSQTTTSDSQGAVHRTAIPEEDTINNSTIYSLL